MIVLHSCRDMPCRVSCHVWRGVVWCIEMTCQYTVTTLKHSLGLLKVLLTFSYSAVADAVVYC
jgi:hypothetical protein